MVATHVMNLSILQTSNSPTGTVKSPWHGVSPTSFLLHQANHPYTFLILTLIFIIIVRYLATTLYVCLVYQWKCEYEWVLCYISWDFIWKSVVGIAVTYTGVVSEVCKWLMSAGLAPGKALYHNMCWVGKACTKRQKGVCVCAGHKESGTEFILV